MNWIKRLFSSLSFSQPAFPPSDSPPHIAATLMEAEQMASELADYLMGDQLFRQIVVETPAGLRQPKMTLGGLVERIEQLEASNEVGVRDRRRVQAVRDTWETIRQRYPEQVKEKLQREMKSYLHSWRYYLQERAQNPEKWKNDYDVELRNRKRVELVIRLLGPDVPPDLKEDLDSLDSSA